MYVSNTTNKSDGVLCFKDNNYTLDTIPYVFNTTCAVHGQYVIYFNEYKTGDRYANFTNDTRYAFNELCELEVYGKRLYSCYLHFYYLFNQVTYAFDLLRYKTQRNIIDLFILLSFIGCPNPGFYGLSCNKPCTDPNCRYCHIETGACQGCKPGYQGHRCELGNR